jgi:hypothetical protein
MACPCCGVSWCHKLYSAAAKIDFTWNGISSFQQYGFNRGIAATGTIYYELKPVFWQIDGSAGYTDEIGLSSLGLPSPTASLSQTSCSTWEGSIANVGGFVQATGADSKKLHYVLWRVSWSQNKGQVSQSWSQTNSGTIVRGGASPPGSVDAQLDSYRSYLSQIPQIVFNATPACECKTTQRFTYNGFDCLSDTSYKTSECPALCAASCNPLP